MNTAPKCIITGCTLIDTAQDRQVHGDLHQLANTYIFNAVLDRGGEAAWQEGTATNGRAIYVDSNHCFERRGVIVCNIISAYLNTAAFNYLVENT